MCDMLYITLQPYIYQNKYTNPAILCLSSQIYAIG